MEIFLKDVRMHAHHGVFEQERRVGNEFIVDLLVSVPDTEGMREDALEGTVSYADLFEIVRSEMQRPRKLLEAVAISICEAIKLKFPQISKGELTITKSVPPIAGIAGHAGVRKNF